MPARARTSEEGLNTLFKPYQSALLEHIWEINKDGRVGISSGQAHRYVQTLPEKRSRAAVIFSLNDMVDDGVLEYEEESGKGGYHRVYYPKMNREEFAFHVIMTINDKLGEVFSQSASLSGCAVPARARALLYG